MNDGLCLGLFFCYVVKIFHVGSIAHNYHTNNNPSINFNPQSLHNTALHFYRDLDDKEEGKAEPSLKRERGAQEGEGGDFCKPCTSSSGTGMSSNVITSDGDNSFL